MQNDIDFFRLNYSFNDIFHNMLSNTLFIIPLEFRIVLSSLVYK